LVLLAGGLALAAWRRYPVSYTMALLSIGVFVVQLVGPAGCPRQGVDVGGALIRGNCVVAELSFIPALTGVTSRILTPFTYMFVHADLLHIAGNMFMLLTVGPALEERIGHRNFLLVYVAAGLGAAAASVGLWLIGFFQGGQEFSPNVGASGAIFGVLTAFAFLYPREKLPMMMPMMWFVFWLPSVTVLLLYLAFNLVYMFTNSNIAWWGHFAGFLVGLAIAPLIPRRAPTLARAREEQMRVDTEALKPVATTHMQRSALRELERLREPKTPDDRAMAQVWWDRFVAHAHCPACSHKLELRDGALACPKGDFTVNWQQPT
jgi:rhomboid family protein